MSADPRDPHEHLQLIVEPGGGVVLDVLGSHHELGDALAVAEQSEVSQVLDPGTVEVRHVAAVVDDPLRVSLVKARRG